MYLLAHSGATPLSLPFRTETQSKTVHREVWLVSRLPDLVDRDDIRVPEARQMLRLLEEPFEDSSKAPLTGPQHFHRDHASQ